MAKNNQNNRNNDSQERYKNSYNEESLFASLTKYAKKMGREAANNALILYYTLVSTDILLDKSIIIGALGYLIMPFDLMPDFLPGGLVDDIGVLLSAIQAVASSITPQIKLKAKNKLKEYFD